ncbi:amidohydrolase family protein [Roseomonas alkaliterrae]|uniref:Guanine deaminase n=1 Tax=Neoroseomonas alkaliterrae TaxID=1452450 RepID=A0A840XPC0_9PROT|nr:amidohydrolase family protein [Neoroseomonas alkaliterrae]MBB5689766.1 guanine deaminase [Neoroseomonas alkaliterrae]MBR0674910.1 amidohydrolase family protein [Neoroseomonas alkaliterrae]
MAETAPGSLLIRGALLADPGLRRAAPADVLITDGVIREVGTNLAAPGDARVMEATGCLIHPGLINAHTHGHGGLSRGQGDKWTLELLLAAAPWIGGNRALADKKLTTRIVAAEMVLKGCTAAYDLYYEFPLPTADGLDAVAEAYHEVGMRAVIAPMVADRTVYEAIPGLYDALPPALQARVDRLRLPAWERTLDAMRGVLANWRWAGKDIRAAVAPTIPHHCSDAFLCACRDLAREHKVGLHSHMGESKVQALTGIRRYGRTLVGHMDSLGLIGPDFTAAHGIWLDDDDLRLLRDRGASLAHNPGSNMRLGNGMFRFRRARDLGVTVGIGTDGANCSDNQNMYEAMRYASMLSKVQTPDPRHWAGVEEIYTAATEGSARALGFSDIGAIAPGMKADIVFLDLASVNWIPHNWSVNQLVHAEDGTGVRHVMIGGRMVVQERRLLTLDLAKVATEAEAARERLEALNAEFKDLYEKLEPVVASFCPAFAAQPYHLRQYLCDAPA